MTLIESFFYFNGLVALVATALAMTAGHPVHALLYFIISLLSVAVSFYLLNAPFAAALEVIVYAGAIMVLFVFVIMLLNLKKAPRDTEQNRLFKGPTLLAFILACELIFIFATSNVTNLPQHIISPKDVAIALFTTYGISVELGSFLLLAGLVGAYHVGRKRREH